MRSFNNALVLKQAVAIILYAWLTNWNKIAFIRWITQLKNLLHAGAGMNKIRCFGVDPHVVWEMTGRCNLRCVHCHAFGGEAAYDELTKDEGMALIDNVAASGITTFVFTGGEPLLRADLFDLIAHARSKGLNIFLATNGTLITREVAKQLRRFNVGVVIGLDSMKPGVHDAIRGVKGAYDAVIAGIENCIAEGLYLHLNIVASRRNFDDIERVIDYGNRIGVYSYFIYNFVPCGRGETVSDYALDDAGFKALLELILRKQRETRAILIPVAAPEYWAYVLHKRGIHNRMLIRFFSHFLGGCIAGEGMMYIKPNGDVWACPFLPFSVGGNVRRDSIEEIRNNLHAFSHKSCECAYKDVCGGCKARMSMRQNQVCEHLKREEQGYK